MRFLNLSLDMKTSVGIFQNPILNVDWCQDYRKSNLIIANVNEIKIFDSCDSHS